MTALLYNLFRLVLLGGLFMIAGLPARAQKTGLPFNLVFPFKDGFLCLNNTFVKDRKKEEKSSNEAETAADIYTFYVYGKRTTLCAMPFTLFSQQGDTFRFPPFFERFRSQTLDAENLLTRVGKNGKTIRDWQTVTLITPSVDSFIHYYPGSQRQPIFLLADDSLQIDEVLQIDVQSKTRSFSPFTFYIRRIPRPMQPRLLAWLHEWQGKESRISPQMINRHVVNRNIVEDKFESGELQGGDGAAFHNESIAPTSSFIFYFGKADSKLADSTMEYRILGGRYTDSTWTKTGHLVMMDGLTGNEHYSLEIRYIGYPENTALYTFVTKPYWYQQNRLKLLAGALLSLLLLLLLAFIWRRKLAREKAQKAALADRLKNLQTQLNPHFIFNALGSIQSLMSKQENDKAHQYLSTFGSLLRHVLINSTQDTTTLDQEVRALETYLQLEQLRFQFRYSITVASGIQTAIVSLPVMLLQPLVENAIRHGIAGMEEKGQVRIIINKEGANLFIAIEDNGRGFDTRQSTNGYGLKLVKEKIQLINALEEQQAIHLHIQSSDAGTTVHLNFKNWLA